MITILGFPWISILIATVVAFVFFFIWYTVFGKTWAKLNKIDPNSSKKCIPVYGMLACFITSLIQAVVLYAVLRSFNSIGLDGEWLGAVILVGLVPFSYRVTGVINQKQPTSLIWLDGGSSFISVVLMGLVFLFL